MNALHCHAVRTLSGWLVFNGVVSPAQTSVPTQSNEILIARNDSRGLGRGWLGVRLFQANMTTKRCDDSQSVGRESKPDVRNMEHECWTFSHILIYIQQDATLHSLFLSGNCVTLHPVGYTGWAKSRYTVIYILYTYFWPTLYIRILLRCTDPWTLKV